MAILLAFLICSGCTSGSSDDDQTTNGSNAWRDEFYLKTPFVQQSAASDPQQQIARIVESEKIILELDGRFRNLAQRLCGSEVNAESLFANTVSYVGLRTTNWESQLKPERHPLVAEFNWPTNEESQASNLAEELWSPLTSNHRFSECQFGFASGEFSSDGKQFRAEALFEGKLEHANQFVGVNATQTIDLALFDSTWKIIRWHTAQFSLSVAEPLFQDVTATAIPDADVLRNASKSWIEDITRSKIAETSILKPIDPKFPAFNNFESSLLYPAVSVVDYDNDGWDDLFLMDRGAPATLLHNEGDGTFKDATTAAGLVVDSHANCALFADFDNDGDQDAFIGRTLLPSIYFINDDGKFRHDESMDEQLEFCHFVVSGSVADINRDGLLDIYLSTYSVPGKETVNQWATGFYDQEDLLIMKIKANQHPFVDRAGPPNVLLLNRGGRFERVAIGKELKQFRNSYQSAWTDIDGDGDVDLYVCNDFAPDAFLRNDTPRGSSDLRFKEVASEVVPGGTMGFGMGASWGDYDNDADLDLYVSNMYSKAGKRIVDQAGDVDPRTKVSAQGNFLYQFDSSTKTFAQVAGLGKDDVHVSKVGWSFGGQFADFDNDTNLDVYVSSGFFSAPPSIASDLDL